MTPFLFACPSYLPDGQGGGAQISIPTMGLEKAGLFFSSQVEQSCKKNNNQTLKKSIVKKNQGYREYVGGRRTYKC